MPNKNTKEYIIKKFNEAGIPLEVKKTNAYTDKNFSRIINKKAKKNVVNS
ncbi:hypothetical protein [Halanaerobium praevalens]|uniref:Uncharacterized protein n=1 Tax=Halanaerobium praevalens (strain ATCC 33744 / DSM 2228 / GSL) TaxID=572479 RepID=E3DRU2_HALPG|nr:hypothetical protein [Halanaerobium praevalens]ADO78156.1 hypothetical protein Hprae_2034 [Halanaerobium praevalens DSM 2228]